MSAIPPVFQERVLNAVDVCSNCFGLIREERETVPSQLQKQNRTYPTARYARVQDRTSVEHVPDSEPMHSRVTFCDCGCTSSFDRFRDEIVSPDRFRELLRTAIETVESKGVSLSRQHAINRAMSLGLATETRFPTHSADEAIAEGIEFGVSMAAVQSSTPTISVTAD